MDKLQSSDSVSRAPVNSLDCGNVVEITKSKGDYTSTMFENNDGFVKSTADGMVFPQFPCLLVNCHNRPGPLITPNVVPIRPVSHSFETPESSQRISSAGSSSDSDTIFVDYRTHSDKDCDMNDSESLNDSSNNTSGNQRRDGAEKKSNASRLNKFVRRLHDMLCTERNTGLVQWRRGLLVLLDTKAFAKDILPKYFNTRNFKTFRRQLNYYGFVHVRSYIASSGNKSTTALWVNQELATGKMSGDSGDSESDLESVSSVLQLKRVDAGESVKTSEGRRERKELALSTIEDDLGVSAQFIALHQLHTLCDEQTKAKCEKSTNKAFNQSLKSILLREMPQGSSKQCGHNIEDQAMTLNNNSFRGDSNGTVHAVGISKPPTSSASAANLLLLLSSGRTM